MRVKKNDTVLVLTGKDKGKQGIVIDIDPKAGLVKVKDVAVITKHVKARRQGETSAIKKLESFIDLSNVMPVCSSCSRASRVRFKVAPDGKKARICGNCQEVI